MKKYALFLIISILLCSCFTARAQYNNEAITYKSFGNYLNSSGDKLSKADMQGLLSDELYTDYLKGRRKLTTGLVFTGVGVVAGHSGLKGVAASHNSAPSASPVSLALGPTPHGLKMCLEGTTAKR